MWIHKKFRETFALCRLGYTDRATSVLCRDGVECSYTLVVYPLGVDSYRGAWAEPHRIGHECRPHSGAVYGCYKYEQTLLRIVTLAG